MSQGKLVMVYVYAPPKGKTFVLRGEGTATHGLNQEHMSRSIQLHYIPVTAFS